MVKVATTYKGGDAIMGKEVVVRGCIDTRARSTDVVGPWCYPVMRSVTLQRVSRLGTIVSIRGSTHGRRDLVVWARLFARFAILCSAVRVLAGDWHCLIA